jgi:hypothetical protein
MNPKAESQPFNPWPWALIAFFVFFVSLVAAFITFAVRQDMDLVREDYYEQEVRYQEQIDRMNRTLPFGNEVAVVYDPAVQAIDIRLPSRHAHEHLTGRIQFYRPSDASLDHDVPLLVGADGRQRIAAGALAGGLWNLQVFWEVNGEEFYTEQTVVIAERKS